MVERSAAHALVSTGPSLLEHLETVPHRAATATSTDMRFPVQYVIRPNLDFRGYAGQVASGVMRPRRRGHGAALRPHQPGEVHRHLRRRAAKRPSRRCRSRCASKTRSTSAAATCWCCPAILPHVARRFEATLVWMNAEAARAQPALPAQAHHPARAGAGAGDPLPHRRQYPGAPAGARTGAERNRRGQRRDAAAALSSTPTASNRATGSFILIDPITNETVGAGMILEADSYRALPGG